MLPRLLRLPSDAIRNVYRIGKKLTLNGFQFIYIKKTETNPRFAIIVPKSVDKRAVARNRIKRLWREAIRLQAGSVKNIDGIFMIRNKEMFTTYNQVDELVNKLFQRL